MSDNEVTHEEEGPYIVDQEEFEEQGGNVAVCECGLSANKPFCEGSHQTCADEQDGDVYKYENDDDDGDRHVVEN